MFYPGRQWFGIRFAISPVKHCQAIKSVLNAGSATRRGLPDNQLRGLYMKLMKFILLFISLCFSTYALSEEAPAEEMPAMEEAAEPAAEIMEAAEEMTVETTEETKEVIEEEAKPST